MDTKIIAHRGASKYSPENTMPAFELAYEMKADGIETDVQLTKDSVPILMHDEQINRTTNGSGYIQDYTWNELKNLDAGRYFSKGFANTPIPTLRQFLEWAKDKALYLNLELKNNKIDYKDIEPIVLDMLREFGLKNRTTISSFNAASVKRMRQLDKEMDIALLSSRKHENLAKLATDLGASSLHIKYTLLNDVLCDRCESLNLPIRVYTVNRTTHLMKAFRKQVDGIITDMPDKARRVKRTMKFL